MAFAIIRSDNLLFSLILFIALNFSKSVAELESVQQKLTAGLANNADLLRDTQKK